MGTVLLMIIGWTVIAILLALIIGRMIRALPPLDQPTYSRYDLEEHVRSRARRGLPTSGGPAEIIEAERHWKDLDEALKLTSHDEVLRWLPHHIAFDFMGPSNVVVDERIIVGNMKGEHRVISPSGVEYH